MDKLTYTSPTGAIFNLDGRIFSTDIAADIRSSEWGYSMATSGALSGIDRVARDATMQLVCSNIELADEICYTFDYDMAHYATNGAAELTAMGGWKQSAVIGATKVKDVSPFGVTLECTVLLLDGVWRKTTLLKLVPDAQASTDGLDYPHDYEHDYSGGSSVGHVSSLESSGCKVRITFFGACTNPYIRIGSNTFGVNSSAADGERIVIDPTKRKIVGGSVYKVASYGEKTNLYASRVRGASGSGSYIFEELPAGTLDISWPQSYSVDIEMIEERGILPWI